MPAIYFPERGRARCNLMERVRAKQRCSAGGPGALGARWSGGGRDFVPPEDCWALAPRRDHSGRVRRAPPASGIVCGPCSLL